MGATLIPIGRTRPEVISILEDIAGRLSQAFDGGDEARELESQLRALASAMAGDDSGSASKAIEHARSLAIERLSPRGAEGENRAYLMALALNLEAAEGVLRPPEADAGAEASRSDG